jgi:ABC-type multidrug transport system ATPase subunit
VTVGVAFEDLSYSVQINKDESLTILKNLNGAFAPGKLVALMGPSGSGKSTLLDVLAGRKTAGSLDGKVFFNGRAPTRDDHRFRVGYVEQFDTLVGELTVENMLRYTADLKLPNSVSAEEREARVEEVIQMLDLESCRSTVIGSALSRGISGGQAKRVNIGLALITRPPILFLDEPTSGLDSRVADEVIELLKQLAHQSNRTIVCTIHSPTGHGFSLFDDLYMIHKGQTIYDGPVNKSQTYFESLGNTRDPEASLPEWLVDLTSDMESIQVRKSLHGADSTRRSSSHTSFMDAFQASEMMGEADKKRKAILEAHAGDPPRKTSKSDHAPSEVRRLVTLLKYRSIAHLQDAEFMGTRFGDKTVFALLILSLYYGIGEDTDPQSIASVSSLLFFICALCGFGAAAFVPTLNLERKLFYRELADGCYNPMTYYFSKFIEEAAVALVTSTLFCVIVFFGLKLTGNFGVFLCIYYLTTLIGVILAYAVSAAVPSL